MNQVMDIHEILQFLPHRYPFLLIDRVLDINLEEKSLVAIKNVTMNENFFNGHFPGRPVMPGVLILEAMAQAGAVLAYKVRNNNPDETLYYFAGIDNARFRRIVEPGDQLRIHVKALRAGQKVWVLEGNAYVGDDLVCSAEFMSASKERG